MIVIDKEIGFKPQDVTSNVIVGTKAGDMDCFGIVYSAYRDPIYRRLFRRSPVDLYAEVATDNTFDGLPNALSRTDDRITNPRLFRGWLNQRATNKLYDVLRHEMRIRQVPLDLMEIDEEPTIEDQIRVVDIRDILVPAVCQLSEAIRRVIVLYYLEDLTIVQVSQKSHQLLGTVKTRKRRGEKQLRALLSDQRANLLEAA